MTIEKRLRLIVERKFPTGGLCYQMQRQVRAAQQARLDKWNNELKGLTPEQIENKIKQWESDT
jgi:hypothetical protein